MKLKIETSQEEKIKKSPATSKKKQGTKTPPKQNVTEKLASDKRKPTNTKIPPKAKNKIPDVKNKPPPSEYGSFPKIIIRDVLQHKKLEKKRVQ